MGLLTASTATGGLIFLPLMARIGELDGWRPIVLMRGLLMAALVPLAWLLLPERPQDVGAQRYGETALAEPPPQPPRDPALAILVLFKAARTRTFWLLFGTFFVCGLTTNGLVGTHLVSYCGDRGLTPVHAACWTPERSTRSSAFSCGPMERLSPSPV